MSCLIDTDVSKGASGKLVLPKGIFEGISNGQLFLATKKKISETITLWKIKEDTKVYEVYCEIGLDKKVGEFILKLKDITVDIDDLTLLNCLDGICKGTESLPCSFDGFVMTDREEAIDELRDAVVNMTIDDMKIVKTVVIRSVSQTFIDDEKAIVKRLSIE